MQSMERVINIIFNNKSITNCVRCNRESRVLAIIDHLQQCYRQTTCPIKTFGTLQDMKDAYSLTRFPSFYLEYDQSEHKLCLMDASRCVDHGHGWSKPMSIAVDFMNPTTQYKIQHSYNSKSSLIKAVSVKNKSKQDTVIIDGTAGLGGDAYVISTFGFQMVWLEENPLVWAILRDGYNRCRDEAEEIKSLKYLFCQNVRDVVHANSTQYTEMEADVVYLDPMFTGESIDKKATPKKEMQILRGLLHTHLDECPLIRAREEEARLDELITWALKRTTNKVVLKRPKTAPKHTMVHHSYAEADNIRYDVIMRR